MAFALELSSHAKHPPINAKHQYVIRKAAVEKLMLEMELNAMMEPPALRKIVATTAFVSARS